VSVDTLEVSLHQLNVSQDNNPMKYFSYTEYVDPVLGYLVGPAKYIQGESHLGRIGGDRLYGYADIANLDNLVLFNAVEVSEGDYYRAIGEPYKATIVEGYTSGSITIAIDDESLTMWTRTMVLLREGGAPDNMPFGISDINGVVHSLPVSELRSLLVQAGNYFYTAWLTNKSVVSGSV